MSEQEERLIRCFAAVFQALTKDQIRVASAETAGTWDSLATVTLTAVVEQEFNVEIDPADMPDLVSFEAFLSHLRRLNSGEQHL